MVVLFRSFCFHSGFNFSRLCYLTVEEIDFFETLLLRRVNGRLRDAAIEPRKNARSENFLSAERSISFVDVSLMEEQDYKTYILLISKSRLKSSIGTSTLMAGFALVSS